MQELPDEFCAVHGFRTARFRLHGAFKREQFPITMIECVNGIIGCPDFAEGVFGRIENALHFGAEQQGSGKPDGTKRIQPVSVLHHSRLQRSRRNRGRETMCFDGVRNLIKSAVRPVFSVQPSYRLGGSQP